MSDLSELPFLDINSNGFLENRWKFLQDALEEHPIYRSDRGVEILAYEPQMPLLRDRRLGQDQIGMVAASGVSHPEVLRYRREMLNSALGREHVRLRSTVAAFFGKQYVEAARPTIRAMIETLLDEAGTGTVNLLPTVCERLPAQTYTFMVGAPLEDEPFITRISNATMLIGERDPALANTVEGAYLDLMAYTEERFEALESEDTADGPLSNLVKTMQEGVITRREAMDLAMLILEASTDNTTHQMALVAATLLEDPARWREIRDDRSLIGPAIDECLRLRPRALQNERRAHEDLEWNGFDISEGSTFVLSTITANLDPAAYPEPEKFDLHREKPSPLVMFGGGMQMCLGSNLARVEFQEFISALMDRYPSIELASDPPTKVNLITLESLGLDVVLN